MAMANKKKLPPSKRSTGDRGYAIPGLDMREISKLTLMDGLSDESDNDDEMEAELDAIISGRTSAPKKPKKQNVNMNTIENMVEACMQSDESDGDENLSGDDDLLAELNDVMSSSPPLRRGARPAPPVPSYAPKSRQSVDSPDDCEPPALPPSLQTLQERLENYRQAGEAAKAVGDNSKVRRYGRSLETLQKLIKDCKNGRKIDPDDVPPPVAIGKKPPQQTMQLDSPASPAESNVPVSDSLVMPVTPPKPFPPKMQPAPSPSATPSPQTPERPALNKRMSLKEVKTENTNNMLTTRRDQYKAAALNAKKAGDTATALKYVRTAKQFDTVIEALAAGKPIDLSKMPPPPPREMLRQNSVSSSLPPVQEAPPPIPPKAALPAVPEKLPHLENFEGNEEDAQKFFNAPSAPKTVLEALQQRLEKYQLTQKAAVDEGNASKAKRLGRIVKQYEDAIKCHKAGKPVDFESLPNPPGFGEIPVTSAHQAPPPVPPHKPVGVVSPRQHEQQRKPVAVVSPNRPQGVKTGSAQQQSSLTPQPSVKSGHSPSSLLEKQMHFLTERQRLFREAALEAKKSGDIEQAKEYLRMSKGLEPMIEATRSGLPIDSTTIPTPPQLKEEFVILEKSESLDDDYIGDKQEMFRNLERDLTKQIDICIKNRDHFLKLGDIASGEKFERLCIHTKQDLCVIQNLWKKGESLPKFHYETRVFIMVQCNSDLGDNELTVQVVRGINLPGKPKDLDSYVKLEFQFPTETPQTAKTHTVKDTNTPEYNFSCKFDINRKSKSLSRVFKRHGLKLDVWSKGGLFRSDSLLGTANVKLSDFDTMCTIHDSFDIMCGRKTSGGKLEVKVCIREPLLAKQIEEVKERWLVIGS